MKSPEKITSVDGKFGHTFRPPLNGYVKAAALPEYFRLPLTIEAWVYYVHLGAFTYHAYLLGAGPRESLRHWELLIGRWYDERLWISLPGCAPAQIASRNKMPKDQWSHVAAVLEPGRVRLYLNGQVEADETIDASGLLADAGQASRDDQVIFASDGVTAVTASHRGMDRLTELKLDEVRISSCAREIAAAPTAPFEADRFTIGLWHFDAAGNAVCFKDDSALANHAQAWLPRNLSLNEVDRASFQPGPGILDSRATTVKLAPLTREPSRPAPDRIPLDGEWLLVEGGAERDRLGGDWSDAVKARVPGSVHTALFKAGRIQDPTVGLNAARAKAVSFETHWYRKTFADPGGTGRRALRLDGLWGPSTIWLNGVCLGRHERKFAAAEFALTEPLRDRNELIIRISPIPRGDDAKQAVVADKFKGDDVDLSCTLGWHYTDVSPKGIWKSVAVVNKPPVEIANVFISARDTKGNVDCVVTLRSVPAAWQGVLKVVVSPENFKGRSHGFAVNVSGGQGERRLHYRFRVPSARLWWPVGLGEPNLYAATVAFDGAAPATHDCRRAIFGLRTVETAPLPGGASPTFYNWQFIINGRRLFLKGTNWSPLDVFLDMPKERYDHFVALARHQNIQILRAWGAGLYETEEFYDACDRQGVMVYQEFPNGAKEAVDHSLRDFIPAMRNHPALVWYGGGNEHDLPYTPDIQLMGKYAYEMDGTRPFHRTDAWAGSIHSYEPHWCMGDLESELHMTAPFIGEFGNPSAPNIESVRRYLPADERALWPPREGGSFTHHTMIFNTARDMERMSRFAVQFLPSTSMRNFITGTQLSQTVAARHTLERARSRWPECTGALHYKHNEVYPACSWAIVDYYGVPKLSYYFLQDTYAPLHAAVLFPSLHPAGAGVAWPVFLFDDGSRLSGRWTVTVRAFDADLKLVKQAEFKGRGGIRAPLKLGEFTLDGSQTVSVPLWVVCEVRQGSRLADRTFYWLNYKTAPGCLFNRPAARLSARVERKAGASYIRVRNLGAVPAVAVNFDIDRRSDRYYFKDSFFWLDPGEERIVRILGSPVKGKRTPPLRRIAVSAWNARATRVRCNVEARP